MLYGLSKKLKQLLSIYLKENKEQKDNLNKAILYKELYENLLSYLQDTHNNIIQNKLEISFLFTSLYKDDIYLYEFYSLLVNLEYSETSKIRLKKIIKQIKEGYKNTLNEIETLQTIIYRNKFNVASAQRVKICLKYKKPIAENKYDIGNIIRIINYFQVSGRISNKEELLLINEIEHYNKKLLSEKRESQIEKKYVNNIYNEIPNILNSGYQEHDIIEVSEEKRETLNKFAKEIFDFISYLDDYKEEKYDEIIEVIEQYKNYNLQDNEYNYIIVDVLNRYQEELLTFYELLIDKDIYQKRSDRIEIIEKYYQTLDKYLFLKKYYDKITEYVVKEENTEETEIEFGKSKRLIYSHSDVNITKTKLIKDLNDVPHESYNTIYELLQEFKNNTIAKKKLKVLSMWNENNSYVEIKEDQIRIVLKHIKEDIYAVMGVFCKKSDNDETMYKTIINRGVPNIKTEEKLQKELELAAYTEEKLETIVKEKGRKGIR